MKIRVPVVELGRALSVLSGVAPRKCSMPILSNVFLRAVEDTVVLSATDLDVGITLKVSCEVLAVGEATVQLRALLDMVKMLSGPHVTLESLENHHMSLKSGRTSARLVSLPASDYPLSPDLSGGVTGEVDCDLFVSMAQRTLYSTSVDEERYNLTGVYFEPQEKNNSELAMVSTDGHRLSYVREGFEASDLSVFPKVTLPRKGLLELLRLIESEAGKKSSGDGGGSLRMGISQKHAAFWVGESCIYMKLIDRKFPDYTQVIPKLADKIMRASRHDFLLSLKRVSTLSSERGQGIKMAARESGVVFSCINPEAGEVTDEVAVEYSGPDMEIGLNARYVIDALGSIEDDNIIIKFTDSLSPILVTGMKGEGHRCVIMPMRM